MLNTFKETYSSIRNLSYGRKIIAKTVSQSISYWLKYVIFISIIYGFFLIAITTYTIPQLPGLVKKHIAPGSISMQNSTLSLSYPQPIHLSLPDFNLTIDTGTNPISEFNPGITFLSDQIITKTLDSQIFSQSYIGIPDFYLTQSQLLSWLQRNQITIWLIAIGIILIFTVLLTSMYTFYKLISFIVVSAIIKAISRLFKHSKSYKFTDIYKIVIHSSVITLLFSAFFALSPNLFFSFIELAIFLFFVRSWLKNISPQ